jgi:hypothetical protein
MSEAERPPHAVLARSPERFSPAAVAAVLARRTGALAFDVLPVVRRSWGVVVESGPAEEGEALAAELTAAGQPALAAPTSLLENPAEPAIPTKLALSNEGLEVLAWHGALPPERLPWARLSALCAAGLETRSRTTVASGGPGELAAKAVRLGITLATGIPMGSGAPRKERVVESRDRALVLDLLFLEPSRSLRIEAARFDYGVLGARMAYSAELNFLELLAELGTRAPRALRGKGTRAILGKRPAAESAYESLEDLRREERWLLTLSALRAAL